MVQYTKFDAFSGLLDDMMNNAGFPDFFVVGAQKAATTTLYKTLAQHPDIYVPIIKEPNFFCLDINEQLLKRTSAEKSSLMIVENKERFNSYLEKKVLGAHVVREDLYLSLFRDVAPNQIKGDFSVNYLYSEAAASEISQRSPDSRIIAVVRNPIERAFSQYSMAVMLGAELRSFSDAIRDEMAIPYGSMDFNMPGYLGRGLYYKQLKRYFDCFPREHILVINFEDLTHNERDVMSLVCSFLNISEMKFDVTQEFAATSARFPSLHSILIKSGAKKMLRYCMPRFLKDRLRDVYYKKGKSQQISDRDRDTLRCFFESDIKKLEGLLDKSFESWLE